METTDLLVCGAHMQGLPLNHATHRIGRSAQRKNADICALPIVSIGRGPPFRPGLIRDEDTGQSIEVEVWTLPGTTLAPYWRRSRIRLDWGLLS
ncbi:hypothetical protein P4S72_17985 [Vibrio sp. PP-XX7]